MYLSELMVHLEIKTEAAFEHKNTQSAGWEVLSGGLIDHHLPSGGWMPTLCGAVNHTALERRRSDQMKLRKAVKELGDKAEKGHF